MTETTHLTPTVTSHVTRNQRMRYVEALQRLRRMDATLATLQPSPADYPDSDTHAADLELWRDQTEALADMRLFLQRGLEHVESPSEARPLGSYAATEPPVAEPKDAEPPITSIESAVSAMVTQDLPGDEEPRRNPPQRRAEGDETPADG